MRECVGFGGEEVRFWVICEGKKWDFSEEKWDLGFCEEKSGVWGEKWSVGVVCEEKVGFCGGKSGVLVKKSGNWEFCEEK